MPIITKYLNLNPYFNDGRWLTGSNFKGFFLHSVGVGQPDPLVFWRSWNSPNFSYAGINGFIGDKETYITAPCLTKVGSVKRMPHGGRPVANNNYIGFEMCEPAEIHYTGYGAQFTVSNMVAAQEYVKKTYNNAVELFAKLCEFHHKNPLEPGVIYSHNEGGKLGIASGHVDPEHLWTGLGLPYTMNGFRQDVAQRMKGEIDMTKDEVIDLINNIVDEKLTGRDTEPSKWAVDELKEAVNAGITDGSRPQGYAKREEVAAMVLRSINNNQ